MKKMLNKRKLIYNNPSFKFFFVGKNVMQKSETFTTILSQMLKPEVIKQHEKLISSLY